MFREDGLHVAIEVDGLPLGRVLGPCGHWYGERRGEEERRNGGAHQHWRFQAGCLSFFYQINPSPIDPHHAIAGVSEFETNTRSLSDWSVEL